MKRNSFLFIISLLLITGCYEESSILDPLNNYSTTILSKERPIYNYDTRDLELTADPDDLVFSDNTLNTLVNKKADSSLELFKSLPLDAKTQYSKILKINGEKGGKVYLGHKFATTISGQSEKVKLYAELDIPCGAFSGDLTFEIIFDIENLAVELYPSPYTFDKPVLLNLEFKNVDLSGFDPSIFVFDYLDGTEPENLKVKSAKIDIENNRLLIKEAELHHFSRYGWTRNKSGI